MPVPMMDSNLSYHHLLSISDLSVLDYSDILICLYFSTFRHFVSFLAFPGGAFRLRCFFVVVWSLGLGCGGWW